MEHVKNVCKIGQGPDCCRYLTMGVNGFECAKLTSLKAVLDARTDMIARADNCNGIIGPIEQVA